MGIDGIFNEQAKLQLQYFQLKELPISPGPAVYAILSTAVI